MAEKSVDLAVMNSVAQYMSPEELDAAFATIRRLLKPGGGWCSAISCVPKSACPGRAGAVAFRGDLRLPAGCHDRVGSARRCRITGSCDAGRPAALQRKRDHLQACGSRIYRLARPCQYRAQSMAHDVCRKARVLILFYRGWRVNPGKTWLAVPRSAMMQTARWRKASTREQCIALYPGSNPGRASSLRRASRLRLGRRLPPKLEERRRNNAG